MRSIDELNRRLAQVRADIRRFGEAVIRERVEKAQADFDEQMKNLRTIIGVPPKHGMHCTQVNGECHSMHCPTCGEVWHGGARCPRYRASR